MKRLQKKKMKEWEIEILVTYKKGTPGCQKGKEIAKKEKKLRTVEVLQGISGYLKEKN